MSGIWVTAFVLQWLLLGTLTILVAGVLRYLAAFQEKMRLAAPSTSMFELGQRIHVDFALLDLHDNRHSSASLFGTGHRVVILLVSASCGSCSTLLLQIEELVRRSKGLSTIGWQVVIIVGDKKLAVGPFLRQHSVLFSDCVTVVFDENGLAFRQFGVRSLPTGIAIDRNGIVISQSKNPHADWLYKTMNVLPPSEPVAPGKAEMLVVPAITLDDAAI